MTHALRADRDALASARIEETLRAQSAILTVSYG
jgi:hypothetical protein